MNDFGNYNIPRIPSTRTVMAVGALWLTWIALASSVTAVTPLTGAGDRASLLVLAGLAAGGAIALARAAWAFRSSEESVEDLLKAASETRGIENQKVSRSTRAA